jgi:hypothetical protein
MVFPVNSTRGVFQKDPSGCLKHMIVNGPIIESIGLNAGQNVFGPVNRASATIGRALRLILINAGGTREFDRATLGHPGKYTYCIAENENTSWQPLHVQRGFERSFSTVTVFAAESPNQRNKKMSLVVYNPTSGPAANIMALSPKVKNLQGGVLGVVDNGKTNSNTVLKRIASDLSVRYHFKDVITVKKHSVSHAIRDDDAEMLAQKCDFVLAGIGD